MVKKILIALVFPILVFGGSLSLQSGLIKAHTTVFGDSSIDPAVTNIKADLSMNDSLESIRGSISFNLLDFTSSNTDRDEHMQEMFELKKFTNISLSIKSINHTEKNNYTLYAIFTMHGVKKPLSIVTTITQNANGIALNANFSVKVSDYGMEAPSMLFFTVRDKVNVNATLQLK